MKIALLAVAFVAVAQPGFASIRPSCDRNYNKHEMIAVKLDVEHNTIFVALHGRNDTINEIRQKRRFLSTA